MPEDKQPLVFMIDDDDIFADVVRHRLANESMRMERAANGEDGIQMMQGFIAAGVKPDVILLDISMPGMNGMEVLEKFHADPAISGIPVAILSNFSRADDLSWAAKLGAVKTIDKTTLQPTDIPDMVRGMMQK